MTFKKIIFILLFSIGFFNIIQAKEVQKTEFIENQQLILNESVDYHITSSDPIRGNTSIDLQSEDAWLYLDSIRPNDVINNYLSRITISGAPLSPRENSRVCIYQHGTVIIPHDKNYPALTVYKGNDFTSEQKVFTADSLYIKLESFDNEISSFILKRGYMATMAIDTTGGGFSRVFIADKEDIEIPVLQKELNDKVSFIRTFSWEWPSKKGWCSASRTLENEIDITHSTWFYSWSAAEETLPDQEYVPIKQQFWWPSWEEINEKKYVTHLLGYNEPDHWEQSNVSVDTAIEEWPKMMQSGLRLGTPATTDFNWLYDFMKKCEERNYRVDYVVIHAYWGGLSPQAWYNALKEVHDRTQRPIWIKEWNNGANWTGEWWPESTEEQQQKQLEELNKILEVMDTSSFVERYSLYNWVEDKRALVMGKITQEQIDEENSSYTQDDLGRIAAEGQGDQFLTPAGINYRDRVAPLAYNPANEFIPTYKVSTPKLTAKQDITNQSVNLTWNDLNCKEFINSYSIERKINDGEFEEIFNTSDLETDHYADKRDFMTNENILYRLKVTSSTFEEDIYSNEALIECKVIDNAENTYLSTVSFQDKNSKYVFFKNSYPEAPVVISGGQSYNYRYPLMSSNGLIERTNKDYFVYKLPVWNYQDNPVNGEIQVPFLIARQGNYSWGDLAMETGIINNVRNQWVEVTFKEPFKEIPVVFVCQTKQNSSYPISARVKDVTKEGFKARFIRERKEDKNDQGETVYFGREQMGYVAIEQGAGQTPQGKIKVGVADGINTTRTSIPFDDTYQSPGFLCAYQSSNDDLASGLKYYSLKPEGVDVIKQPEESMGSPRTQPETV